MNDHQKEAIKALKAVKIYYPGKAKRFIAAMQEKRKERPDSNLSPAQWDFICSLIHTYRRQLPDHIHETYCQDEKCAIRRAEQAALSRQLVLF